MYIGDVNARSREDLERELEALRRNVQRLQLEHDLLKKANELLKKDLDIDLRLLTNREKTRSKYRTLEIGADGKSQFENTEAARRRFDLRKLPRSQHSREPPRYMQSLIRSM